MDITFIFNAIEFGYITSDLGIIGGVLYGIGRVENRLVWISNFLMAVCLINFIRLGYVFPFLFEVCLVYYWWLFKVYLEKSFSHRAILQEIRPSMTFSSLVLLWCWVKTTSAHELFEMFYELCPPTDEHYESLPENTPLDRIRKKVLEMKYDFGSDDDNEDDSVDYVKDLEDTNNQLTERMSRFEIFKDMDTDSADVLRKEIENGESYLKPVRYVPVVTGKIKFNGKQLCMFSDKSNGPKFGFIHFSEKMCTGETPRDTLIRGVYEEFVRVINYDGFIQDFDRYFVVHELVTNREYNSKSKFKKYLDSLYDTFHYDIELTAEGYEMLWETRVAENHIVVEEPDKKNVWYFLENTEKFVDNKYPHSFKGDSYQEIVDNIVRWSKE